jgi:protocatechuate 3,4-dioxygenase beta subunit
MNRKTIFSVVVAICVIALAACTTASSTTPSNNITNTIAPTATASSSSDTSAIAPTTSGESDTTNTSNLACSGDSQSASLTPEVTEGPYYKEGSPEQANLYQDGMAGTKIVITGYVYDTNCQPVANALLDFWQADANGNYDNSGYTLRGHQFTDANGRYQLTTVVPGLYPGRTEHIHVKVQAPNGKLITSQLFFPGVSQNEGDNIFQQSLLLNIQESGDGLQGQFNFVVPTA